MPDYRRVYVPGGTYFFTVVTDQRRTFLTETSARDCLRAAFDETMQWKPFVVEAICLMPDHLHCLWTLPAQDEDYSSRWRRLKGAFTRRWLAQGGEEGPRNASKVRKNERAVWQRRGWEHAIRDEDDFTRHMDYIHYNPVKHGLTKRPHDWPWSTFQRYRAQGRYEDDWGDQEPPQLKDMDRE